MGRVDSSLLLPLNYIFLFRNGENHALVGIHMHGAQTQLNLEETTKSKLFAKHEMRKRRETERHVLRKEMAEHAIPRIFVSRRSDGNPNGVNSAICRKDISFLTR